MAFCFSAGKTHLDSVAGTFSLCLLTFHRQGLWKERIHSGSNSGSTCYQHCDTRQFFNLIFLLCEMGWLVQLALEGRLETDQTAELCVGSAQYLEGTSLPLWGQSVLECLS